MKRLKTWIDELRWNAQGIDLTDLLSFASAAAGALALLQQLTAMPSLWPLALFAAVAVMFCNPINPTRRAQ